MRDCFFFFGPRIKYAASKRIAIAQTPNALFKRICGGEKISTTLGFGSIDQQTGLALYRISAIVSGVPIWIVGWQTQSLMIVFFCVGASVLFVCIIKYICIFLCWLLGVHNTISTSSTSSSPSGWAPLNRMLIESPLVFLPARGLFFLYGNGANGADIITHSACSHIVTHRQLWARIRPAIRAHSWRAHNTRWR